MYVNDIVKSKNQMVNPAEKARAEVESILMKKSLVIHYCIGFGR